MRNSQIRKAITVQTTKTQLCFFQVTFLSVLATSTNGCP